MTTWIVLLVLAAAALAAVAVVAVRRAQPPVPDAPVVELATVPSDRRWWLMSRLNENLGGGRAPVPTLETLDLDGGVASLPDTPSLSPVPAPVAAPVSTPLAMPLAATGPGHSPFANQAVRDGRIGLMDEHEGGDLAIVWRTASAQPTSFSDPGAVPEAASVAGRAAADPAGPITLDRPVPDTITWSGPSD